MEFQFRQRPLSLLIGFLLLPRHTPSKTLPRPRLRPRIAIPRKKQRRTTWVRITTTPRGEWPMPSPAMARRFWDKPACSPRRDRTSAGTAASSGPMVLPTRRSWKRMAARTPMPQRYPPMAASSSDTANYRQAPWWRPPGSMPHLHGDPIAPRHRQPRLGSDRSFRRRLGDHRQRGRIGRKPPVVPLPGALVEQWLDHGHAPPGASRRLELHRRSHLRRRLGHRGILLQRFRAARRHLDQWLRHRDRPGRQLRPVFRRDRHFRQWRRHRGLVRAIQ